MRRPTSKTALLAVVLALLGGCGGDGGSDAQTARAGTLEITAYMLADGRARYSAPTQVRAGMTRISFGNATERPRKAQLVRVDDGHTVAQALAESGPQPAWLVAQGGVGSTNPSDVKSVVQWLAPGRYYVRGSDGENAQIATFEVVGDGGGNRRLPATTGTITLDEYRIEASGLRFGRNLIRVRNVGAQPHEVFIAALRNGETLAEVRRSYSGLADRSPIRGLSGQETALLEGQEQAVETVLGAGRYALMCFASDHAGGPPHTTRGMVAVVTIPNEPR